MNRASTETTLLSANDVRQRPLLKMKFFLDIYICTQVYTYMSSVFFSCVKIGVTIIRYSLGVYEVLLNFTDERRSWQLFQLDILYTIDRHRLLLHAESSSRCVKRVSATLSEFLPPPPPFSQSPSPITI